jgi:hypothetical protein
MEAEWLTHPIRVVRQNQEQKANFEAAGPTRILNVSPCSQVQFCKLPATNQPDGQITSDFQKSRQARESKMFLFSRSPTRFTS